MVRLQGVYESSAFIDSKVYGYSILSPYYITIQSSPASGNTI